MNTISFPGLGLEFQLERVAFHILGRPIFWYGIIIALGFLLAVLYCWRRAPEFGVVPDHIMDMLLFAVPLSVLGTRLYYIIFNYEFFRNPDGSPNFVQMLRIWDGGLAIYGGIIAAVLTVLVFTRVRGLSFLAWTDLGVYGLLIGQLIGRWGNFVNIEAYGGPTGLPWRMGIYEWTGSAYQYLEVHPTFLYESLWNLLGFFLLVWLSRRGRRKFDGMLFGTYIVWYGVGRGLIEGLRTDSLYFFGLKLFGMPVRTSQLLAFTSAAAAGAWLIYRLVRCKTRPEELYVQRLAKKEKEEGTDEHAGTT